MLIVNFHCLEQHSYLKRLYKYAPQKFNFSHFHLKNFHFTLQHADTEFPAQSIVFHPIKPTNDKWVNMSAMKLVKCFSNALSCK